MKVKGTQTSDMQWLGHICIYRKGSCKMAVAAEIGGYQHQRTIRILRYTLSEKIWILLYTKI